MTVTPIMSSTTIGYQRKGLWSGLLCSIVVNSDNQCAPRLAHLGQIDHPGMHVIRLSGSS